MAEAYQQAHYAVAEIDVTEQRYRLQPTPDLRESMTTAERQLDGALALVVRLCGHEDQTVAWRLEVRARRVRGRWVRSSPRSDGETQSPSRTSTARASGRS